MPCSRSDSKFIRCITYQLNCSSSWHLHNNATADLMKKKKSHSFSVYTIISCNMCCTSNRQMQTNSLIIVGTNWKQYLFNLKQIAAPLLRVHMHTYTNCTRNYQFHHSVHIYTHTHTHGWLKLLHSFGSQNPIVHDKWKCHRIRFIIECTAVSQSEL